MTNVETDVREIQMTRAALDPAATLSQLEQAAELLKQCVERAYSGDRDAYQTYQAVLYNEIHQRGHTAVRDPKRLWLAQELYRYEEMFIPDAEDPGISSPDEFRVFIDHEMTQRDRQTHPMSVYLYQEGPRMADIDLFLRHHWLRSAFFYRLIGEFALRFDQFADSTPLYENLFDESGNGNPEKAHPRLLANLLQYHGLPAEIDEESTMPEEQSYLNNRIRCLRHPDLAWGLAVVYLIENSTAANHRKIHSMLEKAGIPEPYLEFHYIHGFVDEVHSADLWKIAARRTHDPAFRKAFIRSAQHHLATTRKYYDALWDEMRSLQD